MRENTEAVPSTKPHKGDGKTERWGQHPRDLRETSLRWWYLAKISRKQSQPATQKTGVKGDSGVSQCKGPGTSCTCKIAEASRVWPEG